MTLGWSTSGQRPLSVLPMIPLGTQVSSSSLLLQMPSTTGNWRDRQQRWQCSAKTVCCRRLHSWQDLYQANLHVTGRERHMSSKSLHEAAQSPETALSLICKNLLLTDLESKKTLGLHPEGQGRPTSKPSFQVFSEPCLLPC